MACCHHRLGVDVFLVREAGLSVSFLRLVAVVGGVEVAFRAMNVATPFVAVDDSDGDSAGSSTRDESSSGDE